MDLPDRAGVMIFSGGILFPKVLLPLYIFEDRYRRLLHDALSGERMFCVAMQRPTAKREYPHPVAGLGLIRASVRSADGTSHLVLQGIARVHLGPVIRYKPYRIHEIEVIRPQPENTQSILALRSRVLELVDLRLHQKTPLAMASLAHLIGAEDPTDVSMNPKDCLRALREMPDTGYLADLVAISLLPNPVFRQTILQCVDVESRLRQLEAFLLLDLIRTQGNGSGSGLGNQDESLED